MRADTTKYISLFINNTSDGTFKVEQQLLDLPEKGTRIDRTDSRKLTRRPGQHPYHMPLTSKAASAAAEPEGATGSQASPAVEDIP
ncbi:hypothetical protein RIEGSTA812A_PEG_267 [invertebrate metagenome]|uniref:Uncharacterized protein n=1 Tax=invertebrate metagenome TaxID=1711999 RepID=A0A484H5N8_9ZZZZ